MSIWRSRVQIPSAPPFPLPSPALPPSHHLTAGRPGVAGRRPVTSLMFAHDPLQLLGSLGPTSLVVLSILLVFSIVSWVIILSKWRLLRRSRTEDQRFLHTYDELTRSGGAGLRDLQRLAMTLPHSPSGAVFLGIVGRLRAPDDDGGGGGDGDDVVGGGDDGDGDGGVGVARTGFVAAARSDRDYLDKVIHALVQTQILRQEAYLPFLATTGNLAPFIGLLGTVVGVINAFRQIGLAGTASIAAVAPGVAEALIATAAGLFVAIPAVIGYNYALAAIRTLVCDVERFGLELPNALETMMPASGPARPVR